MDFAGDPAFGQRTWQTSGCDKALQARFKAQPSLLQPERDSRRGYYSLLRQFVQHSVLGRFDLAATTSPCLLAYLHITATYQLSAQYAHPYLHYAFRCRQPYPPLPLGLIPR